MKKIMFFAAAIAALVACSKEVIDNGKTGEKDGQMILSASFDGGTKVAPNGLTASTVTFIWEDGDKIYITPTGGSELEFTVVNNTISGSTASFSGTSFDVANGYSVEYRGSTSFTDGSFKPYAKASDCTESSFTLTMQPVLKLQLKGTAAISKIQYGESNEFTFSTALQLNSTTKYVYLPLNGEFTGGTALKFYDANQTCNKILVINTAALASGNIYTMPDLTVNAYPTVSYYEGGIFCGDGIQIGSVIWAPVNCGYDATSYPYGKLYQWGRKYGQAETGTITPTTMNKSDDTEPNKGDFGKYNSSTYNWFSGTVDNTLWSDSSKGTSDPCPTGWRVPTNTEMTALLGENDSPSLVTVGGQKGCWFNGKSSASSGVFLPAAGCRNLGDGSVLNPGDYGYYWSSSVNGNDAWSMDFFDDDADVYSSNRADGNSVRCVQE